MLWHITPPLIISRSNLFYFRQKDPINVPILKLCSALVKICQNLCHFPNHKLVFLQILHHSSMSWKITPLYLFSSNNIYFAQKETIKVKLFETFECSGQNFSNSLCQFWNSKSIPLQILYPSSVSWKITPLYFFSSSNTLLKSSPLKASVTRDNSSELV